MFFFIIDVLKSGIKYKRNPSFSVIFPSFIEFKSSPSNLPLYSVAIAINSFNYNVSIVRVTYFNRSKKNTALFVHISFFFGNNVRLLTIRSAWPPKDRFPFLKIIITGISIYTRNYISHKPS